MNENPANTLSPRETRAVRDALHNAAIVGVYQTRQARHLPDETPSSLVIEAVRGALDDAGLTIGDVDGFIIAAGLQKTLETVAYQAGAQ